MHSFLIYTHTWRQAGVNVWQKQAPCGWFQCFGGRPTNKFKLEYIYNTKHCLLYTWLAYCILEIVMINCLEFSVPLSNRWLLGIKHSVIVQRFRDNGRRREYDAAVTDQWLALRPMQTSTKTIITVIEKKTKMWLCCTQHGTVQFLNTSKGRQYKKTQSRNRSFQMKQVAQLCQRDFASSAISRKRG